jgi:hypothetical protein
LADFDYTECVEAGSKAFWEEHGSFQFTDEESENSIPVPWELVPGTIKAQIRMMLLEPIVAAVDCARYILDLESAFKDIEEGNSEN